jgi:GGDEF domain-containing protein
MCASLPIADLGLTVSLAIGIASSYPERLDGTDLIRHADVAMYAAKTSGTGYQWYDPATDNLRISVGQAADWTRGCLPLRLALNVNPPELPSRAWSRQ